MERILFMLLVSMTVTALRAQTVKEQLYSYFQDVRSDKYSIVSEDIINAKNPSATLNLLHHYYNDTSSLVRSKAYAITQRIGQLNDSSVRRQAVQLLVEACKDSDAGNIGMLIGHLTKYKKSDFSESSVNLVRNLFDSKIPHMDMYFKLIGFIELTNVSEKIYLYTLPGNSRTDRWAATLCLTRMGDSLALQDMMKRVKKLKINDDIIETIFPDLLYTRQKPAFDYMIEVLKSDEKNCTSSGENTAPIACGYRIMEQLARAVKGYPLELDASGDIKTKDYKQALVTVRAWFETHKDYEIDRDTF